MQSSKLFGRVVATTMAAVMVLTPLSASAKEPQRKDLPHNPVYNDDGVEWDENGFFVPEYDDDDNYKGTKEDSTNWDYIYFGSYPQTRIYDESIISRIDAKLGKKQDENEQYAPTGDAVIDGVKYRKICPEDVEYKAFWPSENGHYIPYLYFKWEPIKWRVLSVNKEEGKMLVMANNALDSMLYYAGNDSESGARYYWSESRARSWLNDNSEGCFWSQAFTPDEKKAVINSEIKNK
ncbi:MAG: DUF6273 domain-containing protein, partial [Lachnospiraceae bacterium]|nr:DUF6273 domain-containing protein [Lachnospiraceae bacterium]